MTSGDTAEARPLRARRASTEHEQAASSSSQGRRLSRMRSGIGLRFCVVICISALTGAPLLMASSACAQSTAEQADETLQDPPSAPGGESRPPRDAERPKKSDDSQEKEEQVRLSDGAELDRIIELYMAGEYEACTGELSGFLGPKSEDAFDDPAVIERGRLYYASCALLSGRREQARAALRDALEANPLMPSPDSLTFPPPLVSLFLEVRDEVQQLISAREEEQLAELRQKNREAETKARQRLRREAGLVKLAQEETVIAKNSRIVASLPFGAGQYQNGNKNLGHVFLVSELALVAGLATSAIVLSDLGAQRAASLDGSGPKLAPADFAQKRDAAFTVAIASSWLLLGVASVGVLEAQLSFKKERRLETRTRPLPAHLRPEESAGVDTSARVAPTFSVMPGGATVGFAGMF